MTSFTESVVEDTALEWFKTRRIPMAKKYFVGVDLGGTNMRAGIAEAERLDKVIGRNLKAPGGRDEHGDGSVRAARRERRGPRRGARRHDDDERGIDRARRRPRRRLVR